MSKPLEAAKKIAFFLMSISLIWILTSDSVKSALSTQRMVEDLAAWVLLTDAIKEATVHDANAFDRVPVGGRVVQYSREINQRGGAPYFDTYPLKLSLPWNVGESEKFALVNIGGPEQTPLFRIESEMEIIKRANYLAAPLGSDPEVFTRPSEIPASFRRMIREVRTRDFDGPNQKNAVMSYLWSRNWQGQSLGDLKSTDPVVATVIREAQSRSYTISGFPVSVQWYPLAVGLLLAMGAMSLAGPNIVLSRGNNLFEDEWWFMVIKSNGSIGAVLLVVQIMIALVAICLPLLVANQIVGLSDVTPIDGRWKLYVAASGAALASISLLWFALTILLQIKRIRPI